MKDAPGSLRILMTADAVGGVWTYALTLAASLMALPGRPVAGVVLAVLGPAPTAAQCAEAAGIANLHLVAAPWRLEWMEDPWREVDRATEWLLDLAATHRPDVAHLNGYAHAAADWPVPVLVAAHSCVLSWWQAVHHEPAPAAWDTYRCRVRAGLAAADAVVAPSRAMLEALNRHYGLSRGGRVIPNGCPLARFRPAAKEGFALAAGRLWDAAKNLAGLDAAAGRLAWPVYVAGDCRHPERGWVEPRHARALGQLPAAVLADWMGRAAVYALPARYEPFGLSVLEAAASGCALVLGDIASLRETWDGAAVFVHPGDDAALAAAISAVMADPERRARLGGKALRRAQDFPASRMARAYADLYAGLAAAGGAAAGHRRASAG
jgi:glycosyltransferase involved in cell wall biosynthesis